MTHEIMAPGCLTRPEWAKRLNDQWDAVRHNAVEGFIALGRNLRTAKGELGHGQWMAMAREDLKFHPHIANSFMRIAGWAERNVGNAYDLPKLLPPDYTPLINLRGSMNRHPKALD
jgi:hypothetical protein